MREIHLFVRFQRILLLASDSSSVDSWESPSAENRLGSLTGHLLMLGVELRGGLPCPRCFLRRSAEAAIEVAHLAAPRDLHPFEAVDHLARIQQTRLSDEAAAAVDPWRLLSPEIHLERAFWQLAGLAHALAGGLGQAGHEEHAADLASSLVFAAVTSGAWERALRRVPRAAPVYPTTAFRLRNSPGPVS